MNKKREKIFWGFIFLVLVLFLISISFISAVDITLKKNSYYSGETLQAEIAGNFVDSLDKENIGIYSEATGSVHKTAVEDGMIKYQNKYFYYAVLPEIAGDYSLRIENEKYMEGNVQKDTGLVKNFTISDTNNSYLSFNPGYIYTSTDFNFIVKAYNKEQDIKVSFPATKFSQDFNLGYSDTKTIYISIESIKNLTKSSIKINSYELPVIISPKIAYIHSNGSPSGKIVDLGEDIVVDTALLNGTILKNVAYNFQILVVNKEQQDIAINVSSSSKEIIVSPTSFSFDDKQLINVTLKTSSGLNEKITLSSGNSKLDIPVKMSITTNSSNVNVSGSSNRQDKCSDLGGVFCDSFKEESCKGIIRFASDGECCIGTCSPKSSGSKAWIWGIVIIIVLGIAGYFVYKKYKMPGGEEKIGKIFSKKAEEYKERMNPEPKEVSKSLGRE